MPARKDRADIKPFRAGKSWAVDFTHPDPARPNKLKRHRRAFADRTAAELFIDQIFENKPDPAAAARLIKEYLYWSEKIKKKAPQTVRNDTSRLARFAAWLADNNISDVSTIDFKTVAAFQVWFFAHAPFDQARVKKRYKLTNPAATWEKYRQNISSFLTWCKKRGYHSGSNPAGDPELKIKTQRKIPPHFSPEDLRKLFDYLDRRDETEPVPWYSVIYRLFAYTGMRFSELANLRWSDLDLENMIIKLSKTKNKSPRTIPIAPDLLPWLAKLPVGSALLLDNGRGEPIYTESWLLRHLVDVCQLLGLPRRRLHDFRHTFAVQLVRARVPLPVIQRLLGHKHISSTMIYITFDTADLAAAVSTLHF